MQLRPHDLGPTWHIAVVRQRAIGAARVVIQPRIGPLGRLWSRGLGLTEKVVSHTLPMAADKTGPWVGGLTTGLGCAGLLALYGSAVGAPVEIALLNGSATLAVSAAAMYGSAILLPRRYFKQLHWQPLRIEELMDLKGVDTLPKPANLPELPALKIVKKFMHNLRGTAPRRAGDGLEQSFLELAITVIREENLPETVQADLRRTLAELGEAVSALPPAQKDTVEVNDILVEAETQAARSRRETDPVLAASHLRHAEALMARARAAEQQEQQYRQTRRLREEMAAQIAAVQAALPTLAQTTAQRTISAGGLTLDSIAFQVQSITREAAAITAAQQELAVSTSSGGDFDRSSYPTVTAAPPQPQETPAHLQQRQH